MIPDHHEADAIGAVLLVLAAGVVYVALAVVVVLVGTLVVTSLTVGSIAAALRGRPGPSWRGTFTDIYDDWKRAG